MDSHGEERNEDIRFEESDASPKALARFMFFLVVSILAVAYAVRVMYFSLASREARQQPPPPIMQFEAHRQAPLPRLEEHESDDLARYRAEQHKVVTTYGWVDKEQGIARVPVEEAMKMLLKQGLPVASPEPAVPPQGEP